MIIAHKDNGSVTNGHEKQTGPAYVKNLVKSIQSPAHLGYIRWQIFIDPRFFPAQHWEKKFKYQLNSLIFGKIGIPPLNIVINGYFNYTLAHIFVRLLAEPL